MASAPIVMVTSSATLSPAARVSIAKVRSPLSVTTTAAALVVVVTVAAFELA